MQMFSPAGRSVPNDKFYLADLPALGFHPAFNNAQIGGRTPVSPALVGGESTAVIICIGQSNICNQVNAQYTPVSSKVHNFNIYDGGCYLAQDPLLGCAVTWNGYGNWLTRYADDLINSVRKYARVILVPIGVGNTDISMWAAGGIFNHRIGVAVNRLASVGLSATHINWVQGENDNTLGTTAANYTTRLQSVVDTFRAAGCTAPFNFSLTSYINGTTSTAVRSGQAAAVDHTSPRLIFQGPDGDTLTGLTNRQSDLTHFNATGADAFATLWANYTT